MPQSLTNQVILITGASDGIGAALARALAGRYPKIRLVLAARNLENLNHVAADCQKVGAEVLVVPTDLADFNQAQTLAHKALAHFEQVDALVNNAGYGQMGPVELVPIEACKRQFEVNVLGALALTQALIPAMRDRGSGRIINISSIAGKIAFPFGGLYSASKFALESLSDTLRMELSPFNIKVSVVEPGPVKTNFVPTVRAAIAQTIPNPLSTPYRATFEKLQELEQRTGSRTWTSEQVAEVIIIALTSDRPRPRYVAANSGGVLIFLMTKLLPTSMVDKFWQKFYGFDRVSAEWQGKKNQ